MIESSSGCFCAGASRRAPQLTRYGRSVRWLVSFDDPDGFFEGVEHLQRTDDDALKRIEAFGRHPDFARYVLNAVWQPVEVQVVACQRSGEIGAAAFDDGSQPFIASYADWHTS